MIAIRRVVVGSVFGLAAMAASGCASLSVHSFAARPATPQQYKSYRWAADGPTPTGDPRLDSNPFFERRLMTAAEREMAKRFAKLEASADLVLHYHASVNQELDIRTLDRSYGVCTQCSAQSVYEAGTIMLDLVDAKTNTLVWRGWVEGSFDGMIDNQAWLEERVDEAVAKIVATIPANF